MLKPCPFCGKPVEMWQDEVMYSFGSVPGEFVISCCVQMRGDTEKQLTKSWNKRPKEKLLKNKEANNG